MMQSSAARKASLIDDVLDFARGRLGGGLSLTCDLNAMLQPALHQVIAELRTTWPEREFETDIAISGAVNCDPGRINQLFSNLLGNALTHGAPDAPVRIEARTDGNTFHLSVANAGKPIPAEAIERLFEPFFRADVQPSQQGLGLGLYIVHEIARAHGGVIGVTSDSSETRFSFRMPMQRGGADSGRDEEVRR